MYYFCTPFGGEAFPLGINYLNANNFCFVSAKEIQLKQNTNFYQNICLNY